MDKYTVKQARVLSDISIRDMAKRLGLSTTTYMNKEKGLSRFYFDEAVKLSEIVKIPMDSIFFTSSVKEN